MSMLGSEGKGSMLRSETRLTENSLGNDIDLPTVLIGLITLLPMICFALFIIPFLTEHQYMQKSKKIFIFLP